MKAPIVLNGQKAGWDLLTFAGVCGIIEEHVCLPYAAERRTG
jgi:hypothetical protein